MAAVITNRVLPGIGVCQEIDLRGGRRVGVVTHRDGRRDLVVYDVEGDGALDSVALSDEEADALAEILGAPRVVGVFAELQRQAAGLVIEQLPLPADSPFVGRGLGDTQARTRTGASIVAIIRAGVAALSPDPEFELAAGDLLVTVGTREGVDQVIGILEGTFPLS
jgi:TrkA domain protein